MEREDQIICPEVTGVSLPQPKSQRLMGKEAEFQAQKKFKQDQKCIFCFSGDLLPTVINEQAQRK